MKPIVLLVTLLCALNSFALEKKHIGVYRQISPTASARTEALALERAEKAARRLSDFYRTYARHKWDVQARGYVMRSDCVANPPNYCRDGTAQVDTGDFAPNYYHVIGGTAWACGQGILGGNRSVTYLSALCGDAVTIHELGHNFSLHHGTDPESADEFGDETTIMGETTRIVGLSSPNIVWLGLDTDLHVVDSTQQVLIAPSEISAYSLRENEHQHTTIPPYFLALHKSRGHKYAIDGEDKLYVYEQFANAKTNRLYVLRPGAGVKLPNSAWIKYEQYADETARVSVSFDGTSPADIPMPTGFPVAGGTVAPEHNGAWYDPDFDGQGFDVHVNHERAVIYWYTFNEGDTSRRYYFGTCLLADCLTGFDLHTTKDGRFTAPSDREVELAGRAQIWFDGDMGVFSYNTLKHGRGSIELQPIALSDSPVSGVYYQPDQDGSGFSVQLFGDQFVAFWYTYGVALPLAYDTGVGIRTQRWFLCSGKKEGEGYSLTIYEASGGRWLSFDPVSLNIVGNATARISGDQIQFNYTLAEFEGVLTLKRLF